MKKQIILACCIIILSVFSGCDAFANPSLAETNANKMLYMALNMGSFGNLEYVKECIENGADVNKAVDALNRVYSPLTMALIAGGDKKIAEYLIEKGADVNYTHLDASLLMAMSGGLFSNTDNCILLVENGAEINAKNYRSHTALDCAVRVNNLDSVKYLLNNGASVSDKTIKMLEYNKKRGYADYNLKRLVFEAVKNQKFDSDTEPIIIETIFGNSQSVQDLIEAGALNEGNELEVLCNIVAFCNRATLEKMVDLGYDVHTIDKNEYSLLYVAASNGNLENLKFLIDKGLLVEQDKLSRNDLLVTAIKTNHYNIAEYLVQQGEKFNFENTDENRPWIISNNPMFDAIQNDNIKLVELLISNGYPLTDEAIYYTVQNSIESHKMDMMEYFLSKGLDSNYIPNEPRGYGGTLLERSCLFGNNEAAKLLIKKGADANGIGTSVPLLNAVLKGNDELVELLINHGANVNRIAEYDDGSKSVSALMRATQGGDLEIIKLLVENGADLEYPHWDSKETVIFTTASTSNNILRYFIESGANIDYQNADGHTTLMEAVVSGNTINVKTLLNAKADITLKNSEGLTALDIAKNHKNKDLANLFNP